MIVDRGYAFDRVFELEKADKTPQVISGTSAVWRLAASPDAAAPLIEKAGLVPVSSGGKTLLQLTLTKADTALLTEDQYYHQLAVTLSDGEPRIHFAGWLQVQARL